MHEVTVLLARHGRTALNAAGSLRGHLDPPLDTVGEAEVHALAAALAPMGIRLIISSPLMRARQTAEAIARSTGAPVTLDERLIDRDYGAWAGHPGADLTRRFGAIDAAPGVEPTSLVRDRALHVLEDAKELHPSPVVLVAHDAVNRVLLTALAPQLADDPRFGQATACWNVLSWCTSEQRWSLEEINRTAPPT